MSGGSKTQTTNTKQESTPWAPAIPAATNILNKANGLLDSGAGSAVYQGPRVAGLGTDTQTGLDMLKSGAQAGMGVAQSGAGLVKGLTGSGGTTAATQAATAGLAGIDPSVSTAGVSSAAGKLSDPNSVAARTGASLAGGAYATDTAPVAGLASNLAGGTSQTQRSLQDVADGKYLDAGNPYLEGIISRGANEAGTAVAQRFAASGRFGSGRFAGAIADSANRIGTEARYADYNAERGRQASAAQAIDAAGLARAGLAGSLMGQVAGVNQGNASIAATGAGLAQGALKDSLAGQTTLAGLDADNITRRLQQAGTLLSSAQGDRAAGLAAAGLTPTIQSALTQAGRDVTTVGAARDAARQDEINAGRDLFEETQAAPWKPLGLAASLVYPAAGLGGTVVGQETKKTPGPSFLQSLLGGISTGVGILGQTGAFPAAAAGAGSAGWLSSLLPALALSDERAKEDIQPVGALHDGQTVYSYRYKGDPTPQIGLLAQEVAERDPGAVAMRPDGLLAVDYARATAPAAGLAFQRQGRA